MVSHTPCQPKCDHHVQDVIAVSTITQMPKIPFISITTHYYLLARIIYDQVWFEAYLQDTSRKGGSVRLPITSSLGRLPVVRAGDTGIIPFGYFNGCRNGAHGYNHNLANADSSKRAGDSCPMYFVNSRALGWSSDPWSAIKCSVRQQYICCYTLLHIILYYYIHLPISPYIHTVNTSLLHIITFAVITHYCISLLCINSSLLHHYYIIITSLLYHFYIVITWLLLHYYIHYHYIIINNYYIIIMHYYVSYYYVLLQNHYYVSLHHYYSIITHYYIIITKGKSCNNDFIINIIM